MTEEQIEQKSEEYLTRTVCQGCRNICEGDCAYAKPVRQAFIDGYKECQKEREWHNVLDGDLPKHNHEVLCILWGGTKEIGYYENEMWYFENFSADNEDVDYWQEITPPKEIE